MFVIFYILCLFHAVLANTRTLSEGEALAFQAVFGTSDMKKLQEIERNPAAYWEERKKALQGETISHLEFCEIYTKYALAYIKDNTPKDGDKPWFCHDPSAIEKTIQLVIPEDHPAYPTAVALYTSLACDHLRQPTSALFPDISTKEKLLRQVSVFNLFATFLKDDFNTRQRWVIRDNANFSLFDSMVLFSEKQYLCGALANNREGFFAHLSSMDDADDNPNPPIFNGIFGPIMHDTISHAMMQYILESHLRRYGISYHQYFRRCWNKKTLVKNNIMRLAQDTAGCFYNFHELSSAVGAWDAKKVPSLIFPESECLTDMGFCKIVRYFKEQDDDFDWHTQEIKPYDFKSSDEVNATLVSWKTRFCDDKGKKILSQYTLRISLKRARDATIRTIKNFVSRAKFPDALRWPHGLHSMYSSLLTHSS